MVGARYRSGASTDTPASSGRNPADVPPTINYFLFVSYSRPAYTSAKSHLGSHRNIPKGNFPALGRTLRARFITAGLKYLL